MHEIVNKIAIPVALILALAGVGLAWSRSSENTRLIQEAQRLQNDVNILQQRRALYQGLVQNLVQYSQVQPNIDAVLVPFGFKPAPNRQGQQPAQGQQAPASTPRPQTTR